MPWVAAEQYKALIGGILYRNVPQPIVCNGKSLLSLTRNTETGQLGVSMDLFQQDRAPIASITNNLIILENTADYIALEGRNRTAVVHKQSGRIWCDLRLTPGGKQYELSVACLLFAESGYPVLLHPDRSKFGTANDDKPPNISLLTLTTAASSRAGAIGLQDDALYLLGIAIENFHIGVDITHSKNNESN
ncbi:MAG: hypothetical protein ABTQ25_00445 [Nitrosomonas ureae]